MCFACGERNPIGLHLTFARLDDKNIRSEFTARKEFQGYKDVVHGGIIGLLLDEVIANVPIVLWNQPVVTAKFEMRLHHPAPVEQKLIITAGLDASRQGRLFAISGRVRLENGRLLATARAKCMKVDWKRASS